MEKELGELRARLAQVRRSGSRRRRGYSASLREALQAYVARRRSRGASLNRIAGELGLPGSTVSLWSRRSAQSVSFREVLLAPSVPSSGESEATAGARVLLVCPAGYRVEGLSAAELPALLRALA